MRAAVTGPKTLRTFMIWGAVADLAVFVGSWLLFGGVHGPTGPMFVLGALNAPIREIVDRLVPMERSTDTVDILLAFVVVLVNGALYGFLVWIISAAWRHRRHRPQGSA